MNTRDIIKNNKMIAHFMGGKTHYTDETIQDYRSIKLPDSVIYRWDTLDKHKKILLYHKSWDWLIPVISKIKSMDEYVEYSSKVTNTFREEAISINTKYIEETYRAVGDFLKWYLENLKNRTLKEKNIELKNGLYRYINHTDKLATTGFLSKENLEKNKDIIRFDSSTIEIMNNRYNSFKN
jgi:hypothetical protein